MIREHLDKCAIVFIDDILISSWSREEHVEQLRIVLGKLGEHKLVANGVGVVSGKGEKNWIFGSCGFQKQELLEIRKRLLHFQSD